jgi:uncharacterized protein DUF4157
MTDFFLRQQRVAVPQSLVAATDQRAQSDQHAPIPAERAAQALNGSTGSQSLMQLRQALDQGPGVQRQASLQRAHNRPTGRPNATGLPDRLKAGAEHLSGIALDDVRVHYNSHKPATVQAHAYAQGSDIHIAPGQERHLPHEAWHVVQQKQGRVKPTLQMKGLEINDDDRLEREADAMGEKAAGVFVHPSPQVRPSRLAGLQGSTIVQREPFVYDPQSNKQIDIGTDHWTIRRLRRLERRLTYQQADIVRGQISHLRGPQNAGAIGGDAEVKEIIADRSDQKQSDAKLAATDQQPKIPMSPLAGRPISIKDVGFIHEPAAPNLNASISQVKVRVVTKTDRIQVGVVTLQYDKATKIVLPHTNIGEGAGGKGIGGEIFGPVWAYIIDSKLIPDGWTVDMAIVGGAMLHLQTRKLSERYAPSPAAVKLRSNRRADAKDAKNLGTAELTAFKEMFIEEHMKYLDALVEAKKNGKLSGVGIYVAISGMNEYLMEKGLLTLPAKGDEKSKDDNSKDSKSKDENKLLSDKIMKAVHGGGNGIEILEFIAILPSPHQAYVKQAYKQQVLKKVAVTFSMTKDTLKEFLGIGFFNTLAWGVQKLFQ